ncbi:hypothetical protein [Terrarubrum flagellatum]|uniref:hypothetical protein n=1 Tax=Terrirubrum flagellatum TaxID=2895980 RepID=UPI00314502A3
MFLDILRWLWTNLRWTSAVEAEEAYQSLWDDAKSDDDQERKLVRRVIEEQRRGEWVGGAPIV